MNFRVSIKQILARIYCAKKKKDLKVTVPLKKELIPFFEAIRNEGLISKFIIKNKTIEICLKKIKIISKFNTQQKFIRSKNIDACLYKDPTLLLFISTTQGLLVQGVSKKKKSQFGGKLLFLTR